MAVGSPGGAKLASAELPAPPPLDIQRHALFLDLDGTLLELEARPELVKADADLSNLLARLSASMNGACAIVTGRAIEDVDRILGVEMESVSGLHGQEARIAGNMQRRVDGKALRAAALEIERLVGSGALQARLEDKGAGLALHYRETPEHARLIEAAAAEIAKAYDLQLMHGKLVVELLPFGASKRLALADMMEHPLFARRMPVAIGDDVTDEDAFQAAWAHGGFGVHVGQVRRTCARYAFEDVAAVRLWIEEGAP
jgi:trehalose 6-phosphate phosphatase